MGTATLPEPSLLEEKLKKSSPGKAGMIVFALMVVGGLSYIVSQLWGDLSLVHNPSIFPYLLLGLALLIALGFEFVNGFHPDRFAKAADVLRSGVPSTGVDIARLLSNIADLNIAIAQGFCTLH